MNAAARALVLLAVLSPQPAAQSVLVPAGATWKYLDDGSDQGSAWTAPGFDDSAWAAGPAELGFGDGDEATVVSYGPDPGAKPLTTYFRHTFTVADPSPFLSAELRLRRDDGAVVHLNGTEIHRTNMPGGAITSGTPAISEQGGSEEDLFRPVPVDPALFVAGANVLAVEVHLANQSSPDMSLDLHLTAYDEVFVCRGPYLQIGGPDRVRLRWRTNAPTGTQAWLGAAPGSLVSVHTDAAPVVEHSVDLLGLTPETAYSYAVGDLSGVLAGDDASHGFTTAPPAGVARPLRIWCLGDSGTADGGAAAVRDAYAALPGAEATSLWLMLGDNAYEHGLDMEYELAVFEMYPEMLRSSVLWPTRGNHETSVPTYYGIFDMPTAGEAGGVPSGSEAYYSFDHGNVHFVCLDSFGSDRSVGGAMWTWCEADLASTDQDWIVAFWHHPPFSKGRHDSDLSAIQSEMRERFVPLLEAGGCDLVLCGHNHSYERSFLVNGHYGLSATFDPAQHLVDGGDGREGGDGAYQTLGEGNSGTVYCVAGSSGQSESATFGHPMMYLSLVELGSLVLDVDGDRLDVRFVKDDGSLGDHFTLEWVGTPFCFGDGSGTPCPCGNDSSTAGAGCVHSAGYGMTIHASGTRSVTRDDLVMNVEGAPPGNSGIFYCGRTSLDPGAPLFDGLQCAGGDVRRFRPLFQLTGSVSDTGFGAQTPSGTYFQAGATYHFQYWSRDVAAPGPCGQGANFSPGFRVTLAP